MPGTHPQGERGRIHAGETEGTTMTLHYSNPALDAELAYRREVLMAGRRTRTKRGSWLRSRRRPH
jgi:hypothetical protein